MISRRQNPNEIGRYLDLGLQFAVAIALGAGGGYLLDKKLHVTPLFFILGLLLGATSGFLNIYRVVFPSKQDERKKDDQVK